MIDCIIIWNYVGLWIFIDQCYAWKTIIESSKIIFFYMKTDRKRIYRLVWYTILRHDRCSFCFSVQTVRRVNGWGMLKFNIAYWKFPYLPVFVIIISVPKSWNLSHNSFVSKWHWMGRRSSELHDPDIWGRLCKYYNNLFWQTLNNFY